MTVGSFKHFVIGAVAIIAPSVPAIVASPAFLHFVENHPVVAAWFPVIAGVVVELFHRFWPTHPAASAP